jgi:glycosyltransferase involved in cell wall biosynthesis
MRRPKVAVDLTYIRPGINRGTETYGNCLINEITNDERYEWLILNAGPKQNQGADPRFHYFNLKSRIKRVFWQQFCLPRLLKMAKVDLLFSPGYIAPINPGVKNVVTIHDMQYQDIPNLLPLGQCLFYRIVLPKSAKSCSKIITVSQFSKRQIEKHLKVNSERISVIYEAPKKKTDIECCPNVIQGLNLNSGFIFSVSSGSPHKNIKNLIKAYLLLRETSVRVPPLIFAGQFPNEIARLKEDYKQQNIYWLGYVSDELLGYLYSSCTLFALASFYEGFGLPILEAMSHGAVVVCSDQASLPEVGGSAAIYFDPYSISDIADKLKQPLINQEIIKDFSLRAKERAGQFSWEKCADETLSVFKGVLNE